MLHSYILVYSATCEHCGLLPQFKKNTQKKTFLIFSDSQLSCPFECEFYLRIGEDHRRQHKIRSGKSKRNAEAVLLGNTLDTGCSRQSAIWRRIPARHRSRQEKVKTEGNSQGNSKTNRRQKKDLPQRHGGLPADGVAQRKLKRTRRSCLFFLLKQQKK